MKRLFLSILPFLFTASLFAQKDHSYILEYSAGKGFIIPHRVEMEFMSQEAVFQHQLRFKKKSFGQKEWNKWYYFPNQSLVFNYFQFGQDEILGSGYSFAASLNFDILRKEKLSLQLTTDAGFGWITQPFDPQENYKNVAMSSHGNIYISMQADLYYRLSQKWELGLGASVSHFSNTAFKIPNLGINIPAANIRLAHHFGKEKEYHKEALEQNIKEEAFWQVLGGAGLNEASYRGDKFFGSFLSIGKAKRFNYRSTLGINLDGFYNPVQRELLAKDSIYIDSGWENAQLGLSVHHVLNFGRFGFLTQLGYYLKTEQEDWGNLYQVVGGRIEINDRLAGFFALKTHRVTAEYFMLGVNYRYRK